MKIKNIKLEKFNNFSIGNKDFQVLTLLYKPVVSADAINVYLTLYELSYLYETMPKISLIDSLGVDKIDEESLLFSLKTLEYVKLVKIDNNEITLYKPLTSSKFFVSPISNYLKADTSKEIFEMLTKTFNYNGYINYPDTYSLSELSNELKYPEERKAKTNDDILGYIKTHKPYEIINNTNSFMSMSDQKTIDRLKNELKVNDELLSLLIVYSLVTNENKLHQFKYYETIILDWRSKNIDTVDEAYEYINSLYSKKKEIKAQSSEEWFNDYWKKIKEENK